MFKSAWNKPIKYNFKHSQNIEQKCQRFFNDFQNNVYHKCNKHLLDFVKMYF